MAVSNFENAASVWQGSTYATPRHTVRRALPRYAIVSVAALGLDVATFLLLATSIVGVAFAGVAGYTFGLVFHYWLSKRFVFEAAAAQKTESRLFGEFIASGLIGLLITTLTIGVGTTLFELSPAMAKLVAVVVSFAAVFALRHAVVFAPKAA